ncbi:MAG: heme ABC transporter permease CcmC [Rickettsiaceae bacterium]|nr:heme ABC transporter permease CcmC [Rickettsiaceae bacterium]
MGGKFLHFLGWRLTLISAFKILNPFYFLKYARILRPVVGLICVSSLLIGLYFSFTSPEDYQQGEMVRIMYIHVPMAWLSLMIFVIMGLSSISCLVWRARFAFFIALASAPIGASFALGTLVTGMIWGKPIWGAWWAWDARLTSMLILFIFYVSFILIARGSKSIQKIEKPSCVIAILGMINVPIVKFSVDLWHSLHQPASILRAGGSSIHHSMLMPLLFMFIANLTLYLYLLSLRVETLVNTLEKREQ